MHARPGYPWGELYVEICEVMVVTKIVGAPLALREPGPGTPNTGQSPQERTILCLFYIIFCTVFKSPNCPGMQLPRCFRIGSEIRRHFRKPCPQLRCWCIKGSRVVLCWQPLRSWRVYMEVNAGLLPYVL